MISALVSTVVVVNSKITLHNVSTGAPSLNGYAYYLYPKVKRIKSQIKVKLDIRPISPSGVIFWVSGTKNGKSNPDYFYIALRRGHVVLG